MKKLLLSIVAFVGLVGFVAPAASEAQVVVRVGPRYHHPYYHHYYHHHYYHRCYRCY